MDPVKKRLWGPLWEQSKGASSLRLLAQQWGFTFVSSYDVPAPNLHPTADIELLDVPDVHSHPHPMAIDRSHTHSNECKWNCDKHRWKDLALYHWTGTHELFTERLGVIRPCAIFTDASTTRDVVGIAICPHGVYGRGDDIQVSCRSVYRMAFDRSMDSHMFGLDNNNVEAYAVLIALRIINNQR